VELNCPVTAIDHSGKTLKIETARGSLSARAAIITIPTTLLAKESIRFTPALPDKLHAAHGLPLGLADKVYFLLEQSEEFPLEARFFGDKYKTASGSYHFRPMGRPLVEGYFGGRLARQLEEAGEGAHAAFALDELAAHFGEGVRRRLQPLAGTRWASDPWAQGSYSYALPGHAGDRFELSRPVNGRIFFAGEACSPENFSTAHGAYETGIAAAAQALKSRTGTA
jgi:monoamine oxidase